MWFLTTGRVVGAGLALTELLAAALFLVRRDASRSTERPTDWAVAFVGTFGALAARPSGMHAGLGDALGLSLQAGGVVVILLGLSALGRSFGLVAAQRDLVTRGPYRVVRHPLYAAYTLVQAGYLVQSFRLWNVAVFAAVWICQLARIRAEERFLSPMPEYRRYAEQTRFKLVPGVW
jgi:protein-S-isoprenylcysteine O-methyltransferase Ste14